MKLPVAISDHIESMGAVEAADWASYAHPHNRIMNEKAVYLTSATVDNEHYRLY